MYFDTKELEEQRGERFGHMRNPDARTLRQAARWLRRLAREYQFGNLHESSMCDAWEAAAGYFERQARRATPAGRAKKPATKRRKRA